ncbi:MAG: hypothetical protein IJS08_06165 [Victivallales bacterium]|nr:hypothetical protein [Victivallales bacterium]
MEMNQTLMDLLAKVKDTLPTDFVSGFTRSEYTKEKLIALRDYLKANEADKISSDLEGKFGIKIPSMLLGLGKGKIISTIEEKISAE